MTEPEELVWFEADGTRHVFDQLPSEEADDGVPHDAVEVGAMSAGEPERIATTCEPEDAVPTADGEDEDEPSTLRGMVRALALGAAAAAATGAAVAAISLTATGDRPDTTSGTVPSTAIAPDQRAEPEAPGTGDGIERVELVPPTTAVDQPG